MKFSNIYRMAKVERCVDCLFKEVIKIVMSHELQQRW